MSENTNQFSDARNKLQDIFMQMDDLADAFARTGNKSVSNELAEMSLTGKAELAKLDSVFSKEIFDRFNHSWVNSTVAVRAALAAKEF